MLKLKGRENQVFFTDKKNNVTVVKHTKSNVDRYDYYKAGEKLFSIEHFKIKF